MSVQIFVNLQSCVGEKKFVKDEKNMMRILRLSVSIKKYMCVCVCVCVRARVCLCMYTHM